MLRRLSFLSLLLLTFHRVASDYGEKNSTRDENTNHFSDTCIILSMFKFFISNCMSSLSA